jgi:hypothetical protein
MALNECACYANNFALKIYKLSSTCFGCFKSNSVHWPPLLVELSTYHCFQSFLQFRCPCTHCTFVYVTQWFCTLHMILHNNSHNMCFISNTIPIIILSMLHTHVPFMYHQYYSILEIDNWTTLFLSLSILTLFYVYSCFFIHEAHIQANHTNTGTMLPADPA